VKKVLVMRLWLLLDLVASIIKIYIIGFVAHRDQRGLFPSLLGRRRTTGRQLSEGNTSDVFIVVSY
jgi:hypothetical protein